MLHLINLEHTTEEFLKANLKINKMSGADIANLVQATVSLTIDEGINTGDYNLSDINHPTYNAGLADIYKFARLPQKAIEAGVKEMKMLKDNGAIFTFSQSDIVTIAQYSRVDGLKFLLENNVKFNTLSPYNMVDIIMSVGKESISILQQGGAELNSIDTIETRYFEEIERAQGRDTVCVITDYIALKYCGDFPIMDENFGA